MVFNSPFIAAAFALTAATCWGAGDFTGGVATRRSDAYRAVLFTYAVGLIALLITVWVRAEPLPPLVDMAWGAVAGLFSLVGLLLLFRAFATGTMGTVAPVSAVLGTSIPILFNALTQGLPTILQLAGFAVAAVGIWLLSRPQSTGIRPGGIGMAILAGIGFGGFFTALGQVGHTTVFWPLVAGRVASCTALLLFALVTRRPLQVRQSPWGLVTLAGLLDVGGNMFYLLALQNGRLDIAAVLGSLFPAVTAVLAWLIIKERLTRLQTLGVTAALLAIVLITL
jgi:drug/metabolite transporter (DMT)-like permease